MRPDVLLSLFNVECSHVSKRFQPDDAGAQRKSAKVAPIGPLAIALRWLHGEKSAKYALILAAVLAVALAAGVGIALVRG